MASAAAGTHQAGRCEQTHRPRLGQRAPGNGQIPEAGPLSVSRRTSCTLPADGGDPRSRCTPVIWIILQHASGLRNIGTNQGIGSAWWCSVEVGDDHEIQMARPRCAAGLTRILLGLAAALVLLSGAHSQGMRGAGRGFSQERCWRKLNAKFDVQQDYRRRGDASTRCELGLLPPTTRRAAGTNAPAWTRTGRGLPTILHFEKARETRRARLRPQVVACVRSHVMVSGGTPEQYRAGCVDQVRPQGRECACGMQWCCRLRPGEYLPVLLNLRR